jgi:hypothetical protein
MNPSEAWTLLTIRSKSFALSSKGYGASTTSDIAALLAGLDREPFLMGMAADLGDLDALRQIELVLWERARHMGERWNWDPPQGEFTVRRMAAVALYEAIDDKRCYVCNGTSEMQFSIKDLPGMIMAPTYRAVSLIACGVRCPACTTGQVRLSGRKKADLAGINKDMWTRTWARRYEPIYLIANGWRQTAAQYLAARIREEESAVDTDSKSDAKRHAIEAWKKMKQIKDSCGKSKRELVSPRRIAAPEANVTPPEVDFQAFHRPVLRLNR